MILTAIKLIGSTLISMLMTVIMSPRYIKHLVIWILEKLVKMPKSKAPEEALAKVEEELKKDDPDLGDLKPEDLEADAEAPAKKD